MDRACLLYKIYGNFSCAIAWSRQLRAGNSARRLNVSAKGILQGLLRIISKVNREYEKTLRAGGG